MNEGTVVNDFMTLIIDQINSGFGFIQNDVWWLFQVLIVINLTLAGIYWAFGTDDVLVNLMRRVLVIGFFIFLIENWRYLTEIVADTFVEFGLDSGGGVINRAEFFDPGKIASRGFDLSTLLWAESSELSGPVGFFTNIVEINILFFSGLVVLLAFFIIAIQIFIAVIKFKIGTLAAMVLVPFAVYSKTTWIAERPLGWVVAAAVRLMVIAFVISISQALFTEFAIANHTDITIREAIALALGSVLVLITSFIAPAMASDLVAGGPSLGLSAVGSTTLGLAAAGSAVTSGTVGRATAASRGIAAVRAATTTGATVAVGAGTGGAGLAVGAGKAAADGAVRIGAAGGKAAAGTAAKTTTSAAVATTRTASRQAPAVTAAGSGTTPTAPAGSGAAPGGTSGATSGGVSGGGGTSEGGGASGGVTRGLRDAQLGLPHTDGGGGYAADLNLKDDDKPA